LSATSTTPKPKAKKNKKTKLDKKKKIQKFNLSKDDNLLPFVSGLINNKKEFNVSKFTTI
ncbi:hypothetical protein, partial [Klebsiella aerogenes]|uniref:hypothetical protein n=1 Tax=Klebsiella aerogenes TaxID=548 RepID=UPI000EB9BE55